MSRLLARLARLEAAVAPREVRYAIEWVTPDGSVRESEWSPSADPAANRRTRWAELRGVKSYDAQNTPDTL